MRALITGGAGFIGSHLALRLNEEGHEVRVLDNFSTGARSNLAGLGESFDLVEGDIQSYERAQTRSRTARWSFTRLPFPPSRARSRIR